MTELELAIRAAQEAGMLLMDRLGKVDFREKNPRDLVTQADLESQAKIEHMIVSRFPDHVFLGEESPLEEIPNDGRPVWVVDPLDGTTNFVHQLRSFSVSIALVQNGRPVLGVVHDPWCNECFSAVDGQGAFLNNQPISVTSCKSLNHALVVTGFSPSVTRESVEASRFLEMLGKAQSIRRLGSAALNLCFLACGRADAYWASSLNAWDVAGGMVILQEAGGTVLGLDGEFDLFDPKFVAASTPELGTEIMQTLAGAENVD